MSVDALFDRIDNYFLNADRLRKIEAFTHAQRQVEGWFKGELIWFLTGGANVWEAEVPFPHDRRKRCDFMVDVEGTPVYLELKALYHGQQRSARFGLGIYLYKDTVGIWGDVLKLSRLRVGLGYSLLFIYPRPDPKSWSRQIEQYKQRIEPIRLREASQVSEYPPELYICKLEIKGDSSSG